MTFWTGLVIGYIVGGFIGFLIAGLCFAAKNGDKQRSAELARNEKRPI